MTSPTAPPGDRYGRTATPAQGRRRLAAAAALLLTLAVGWAAWAAVQQSGDGVAWNDVGYRVRSPAAVEVTFDVSVPDAGMPVVCTLRALNAGHAVVGLIDVGVTPATAGTLRLTRSVPTSETAVTGVVKACAARP
jgi:hypothetical protein